MTSARRQYELIFYGNIYMTSFAVEQTVYALHCQLLMTLETAILSTES